MIELSQEQGQALVSPREAPPRVVDPITHTVYVLIHQDVYERFKSAMTDDAVCTTAEALDRTMAEDDANDPYLAELQRKYGASPS